MTIDRPSPLFLLGTQFGRFTARLLEVNRPNLSNYIKSRKLIVYSDGKVFLKKIIAIGVLEKQEILHKILSSQHLKSGLNSQLESACGKKDIIEVQELIKLGVDLNTEYDDKKTALHIVLEKRPSSESETEVVEKLVNILLKNGAKITLTARLKSSPLHLAAKNFNSSKLVKTLIKKGANPNQTESYEIDWSSDAWTPLHYAVESGNDKAVIALLRGGADKTIDGVGWFYKKSGTPVDLARKFNHTEIQDIFENEELYLSSISKKEELAKDTLFSEDFVTKKDQGATYKILSIDGGGIRGIIPGMILDQIERRAHKPISSLFNLVSGTSTGGILVGGLTTYGGALNIPKYTAEDVLDIYLRKGQKIFPIEHKSPLLYVKYSEKPLEELAHDYFGNRLLSQALTDIIITSYDTEVRTPYFFTRRDATASPTKDFFMRDVIRATSAAPTFLPPKIIGTHKFIDGGVCTNNPAMTAYSHARSFGVQDSNMFIVSLGTGEPKHAPISDWTLFMGQLFWASTIPGVAMDGANFNVHSNLEDMFSRYPKQYHRFQAQLDQVIPLDSVIKDNITRIVDVAETLIEDESDHLNSVVEKLVEH